jgi:CRP-like cAMP-binding protein
MGEPAFPPDFAALPARLRGQAVAVAAPAGKAVFRLGDRPRHMFLVVEGEVRLQRTSKGGAEVVLQRASSGFLAEASLESARYHCDAVATGPSRLLAITIGPFRAALRDDGAFRAFWIARLAREVRLLRSQCERLSLHRAADRIEHYIEAEGEDGRLELSRSRKAWAAELGLTHEVLYRTLATMQRTGRLTVVGDGNVLVLSRQRSPRR